MGKIGSFFSRLLEPDPEDSGERGGTDEAARRRQLKEFAHVCDELHALYTDNDKTSMATWCAKMRDDAAGLLAGGFDDAQLKRLALSIPSVPDASNPKALDNGYLSERWERQAAGLLGDLHGVSMDLRRLDGS